MQISGEWFSSNDGVVRPIVRATVYGTVGPKIIELFLLDTGADRTILSAALLGKLHPPAIRQTPVTVEGIGGEGGVVQIDVALELLRGDGSPAVLRGSFPAFTQRHPLEMSLLGRDILDHFDVVISRPRNEVLLLAGVHRYVVSEA